ncbi:hypothetical protein SDC9_110920 [bioreactor metagenome]|uniref:Uncharacterized protein n=1 Tax=bioreactor metagenome TaxID=1076179 RepID=A0A645BQC7_9ZZZZ
MKKAYTRPQINLISIRSEERLAACEYYYKSGQYVTGCNSNFFPDTSPSSCTITIIESALS